MFNSSLIKVKDFQLQTGNPSEYRKKAVLKVGFRKRKAQGYKLSAHCLKSFESNLESVEVVKPLFLHRPLDRSWIFFHGPLDRTWISACFDLLHSKRGGGGKELAFMHFQHSSMCTIAFMIHMYKKVNILVI